MLTQPHIHHGWCRCWCSPCCITAGCSCCFCFCHHLHFAAFGEANATPWLIKETGTLFVLWDCVLDFQFALGRWNCFDSHAKISTNVSVTLLCVVAQCQTKTEYKNHLLHKYFHFGNFQRHILNQSIVIVLYYNLRIF